VKSGLQPEGLTEDRIKELKEAGEGASTAQVLVALRSFGEADLKQDPNSTLPLDIALAECILGVSAAPQPVAVAPAEVPAARAPVAAAAPPQRAAPPPPRQAAPSPVSRAPEPAPAAERPQEIRQPSAPPPSPPPPQEAPRPAAAAVTGEPVELTLGAARRRMKRVWEESKAASVALGALLNGACDIIEFTETEIVLGFKYPVHAERASQRANIDLLNEITSRVMGRPLSVRCVLDANIEHWRLRENASNNALVRAAQEMGARVMSSEPPEE
jgi:hypothetical protein